MEEDIKILEEMKNNCLTKRDYIDEKAERKAQAIENLINKYKKQEKIIELMAEYISIQKWGNDGSKESVIHYFKKKAKGE